MVRLISFLFLAGIVGSLVFYVTYKSLKEGKIDNPNVSQTPQAISPIPTDGVYNGSVISPTPLASDLNIDLENTVTKIATELGIKANKEDFVIQKSLDSSENVLGFRYESINTREFISEELNQIYGYFVKNKYTVDIKDDINESNPLNNFAEFRLLNINCFLHAFQVAEERNFIELGCNSEN